MVGVAMEVTNNVTISTMPEAIRPAGVMQPQATAQASSEAVRQVAPDRERNPNKAEKLSSSEMKAQVQKSLKEMNAQLDSMDYSIRFSIDDKSKDLVVKIVNKDTNEVIRQIPPAEVLRLRERLKEIVGIILEDTA